MIKLSTVLIYIIVISVVCVQGSPYDQVCETEKYPPDQNTIVPTYRVDLDLPPRERWSKIALYYEKPLKNLVKYVKDYVLEFSPKLQNIINLIDNDLGKLAYTLPSPYGEEIIGIANVTNVPLGEMVLYNIFYEVFTFCTSIVAQDSNNNTYHARNLDFGLMLGWDLTNDTWFISQLLKPLILTTEFTRNEQVEYRTVGFFGFVGVLTGVRPNKVSVSMNERFKVNGGFVGLFEWVMNINRKQSWVTFLLRDVLDKGLDFQETIKELSARELLAPCYYIVGGPGYLEGAVITRNRGYTVDTWILGSNNTWYLAETNYDHWEKPLFVDDRITPTNTCMNKTGQNNLTFSSLFNVLSSKPVLNKLTVYTALMEPKSGKVEAYIQFCPNPCWPF